MRLLLDLQCVQSTSSVRGIGRYALSLAAALVATAGPDDRVEVLLNGGDDQVRLLRARTALETFLPAGAVHAFDAAWPWQHDPSPVRRREAEHARTAAVLSLRPDVVLVGSVFEGDKENVLSVEPGGVPTAGVLYDLIPAADPGTYLLGPGADSYWRRYEELQRLDLLLSISAYAGQQAQQLLGAACPPVVPVWGGPYRSGLFAAFEQRAVGEPPAVPGRYLLAVGGDHPRKNLDRLVQAWGRVRDRQGTALVVACRLNVGTVRRLRRLARQAGLRPDELVLTGEVAEDALEGLYRGALAFVFPSTEEGLGMPPLEAMAVRCPTVLARGSSLSELVDEPEAFFDGFDVDDIARAVQTVLVDGALRDRLREVADEATARFTWARSAELAWEALRALAPRPLPAPAVPAPAPAPSALDALLSDPRPVRVDALPDLTAPLALADALAALGVVTDVPPGARLALAPAPALIVDDDDLARTLVQAGLVETAVLREDGIGEWAGADVPPLLRALLPAPAWPDDLVAAMAHPARWSLERPWPVWLLLAQAADPALQQDARTRGVVLVVAGSSAVVLARSVDRVLVEAGLLEALRGDLHRARCLGTRVTVLGGAAPEWAETATDASSAVSAAGRERTTGLPWSGH